LPAVASSHRSPARHVQVLLAHSPARYWTCASARTRVAANGPAQLPGPPALDAPASSPLSAIDLLERIDRLLALGQHPLQTCVLGLKAAQFLHIAGFKHAKLLSPDVDRLLTDLVLARGVGNRSAVGLPQDRDHSLFTESALSHVLLASAVRAILSTHPWHSIYEQVTAYPFAHFFRITFCSAKSEPRRGNIAARSWPG